MVRYIILLLFIGLAWGQNKGEVIMKNGAVYKGEITEANQSYVFLLVDGSENAQGIPVSVISKSALDDGTLIVENGIIINHIENNQLVKPKISEPIITELVKPKVPEPIITGDEIYPQLEKLNQLDNRLSTIRICPKCGIINAKESKFCNDCGYSFLQIRPQQQKNPALAIGLSFIFPGGGHYYNGQYTKGAIFTISEIGMSIAGLIMMVEAEYLSCSGKGNNRYCYYKTDEGLWTGGLVFLLGSAVVHIVDMYQAGVYANNYNKEMHTYDFNKQNVHLSASTNTDDDE